MAVTAIEAPNTRDEIIARNLAVVEAHFHNETPDTIDQAMALYGENIVWEVPGRGVLLKDHAAVKAAYLGLFESIRIHSWTHLSRWATEQMVFDDSIIEATIVGDKIQNAPFPVGTRVRMRLVHAFTLNEEGKIVREHGYEMWRRADDTHLLQDDIPEGATVQRFD
jgi:hypothetical protein